MTIMTADTGRLAAAMGRRWRAMITKFSKRIARAEFKRTVRDADLPHLEAYGSTERAASLAKEPVSRADVPLKRAKATQACLPIGPCCC